MESNFFLWGWQREQNLSNVKLADKIGVSESYISLVKRGERPLTPEVMMAVARAIPELGVECQAWLAQWFAGKVNE